jgi:hypothetical protein
MLFAPAAQLNSLAGIWHRRPTTRVMAGAGNVRTVPAVRAAF